MLTLAQMTGLKIRPTAPYSPFPWQIKAWHDTSRICVYSGSAGGGKSRAAAEKIHGFCKRYPKSVGIAIRKAREFASKSSVFALKAAIGDDPTVTYLASDLIFQYSNGSRIFIAGMKDESQRQALRSINGDGSVDFIWGEEANAFAEDDYNELLGRLRGTSAPWRQILLTTNPDHPYHWIKTRLMDGGEASVHYSSAKDNPFLPAEYLDILASISGTMGLRLRDGLWVQAEGVVYDTWSDALHMISEMPEGWESWRKIRVIDFGYENPFVCGWWAIDGDGRMYRYREIYMTHRTVRDHAEQILKLSEGETYEATVCDHDASDRATLKQCGISSINAIKDVSRGIQAVSQRLARGHDDNPRLFLLRGALVERDKNLVTARKPVCTEQEIPGYVWQMAQDGRPIKEEPLKVNDHGADMMRYAVMYLDGKPPRREARSYNG